MRAFTPFLPMIAHSILAVYSQLIALIVALCLSAKILWKSKCTMDWMTLIFFLTDFLCFVTTQSLNTHMVLTPFFALAYSLFFASSLLGKEPFTSYYAKKQTPQQYWASPHFLKVNKILTAVFSGVFFVEAALKELRLWYPEGLCYSMIFLFTKIFLAFFVLWFPRLYRNLVVKPLSME